jgi:hypothetical protein
VGKVRSSGTPYPRPAITSKKIKKIHQEETEGEKPDPKKMRKEKKFKKMSLEV